MKTFRKTLLAAAVAAAAFAGTDAHAVFRAYLSSTGVDNATCAITTPCRLMPAALAAVDAGGEIWMLDSANFNTSVVNITKSVTILAVPGALGSLVGNNGTAVSVNGANIEVALRNLNILSFNGSGDIGVLVTNAKSVTIENSSIYGFKGFNNGLGIWVNTGANPTRVQIVNTTIRNGHHGVVVAGNGKVTVSNSTVLNNAGVGLWANSGTGIATMHVNDTVVSNNGNGLVATGSAGAFNSNIMATRVTANENAGAGFAADGGITSFVVADNCIATGNGTGFLNNAGALSFQSKANNTVTLNTANTGGTFGVTTQSGV